MTRASSLAPNLPPSTGERRSRPQIAFEAARLPKIARHMYALMLRNVASDGFQFRDPNPPNAFALPGCVIAAPSYPGATPGVDQDYVYHWVRDAAITIIEIAAAHDGDIEPLVDYVTFSKTCQTHASPTLAHAVFTVDGRPRPWTEQSDGPAVQTLAILRFFDLLDPATQAIAREIMTTNVEFIVATYDRPTRNLWEEKDGFSFFARSTQLACLRAISSNSAGVDAPPATPRAIDALQGALSTHWNGTHYVSMLDSTVRPEDGYDPNIDIVCAAVYGGVPVTDTRLLATAASIREQYASAGSLAYYPINGADEALGIGPLLGRYPGDFYDGDVAHPVRGGHPWALCTANFAELYYRVANAIFRSGTIPFDDLSRPFFAQIGVAAETSADPAATALRDAGDAMLKAVLHHSDHLELSEQFDGTSGYEKSVRNLTWSYAAFLSAVRAREDDTIV